MRLISVRVRGSSSTTKTRRGCSFGDVDDVGRALEGDELCCGVEGGDLGVGVIDTASLELGALGELTWAEDTSGRKFDIRGGEGCPGRVEGDCLEGDNKLSVPTAVSLDRLSNECGRFIDRGRSWIGGVFMPGVSTVECMSAG